MQIETSGTLQNILEESGYPRPQQNNVMSDSSGLFSNQYIIVQDRLIMGKTGSKNAKQNSEPGEIKIVDGTTSFLAK